MTDILRWKDLTPEDQSLLLRAQDVARNAYAPYSGFTVGAAVRAKDGRIYIGANLENASYGLGICAEVSAITAANSDGNFHLDAIAVFGRGMSPSTSIGPVTTPCGRCRQLIHEASDVSGCDILVISANSDLSEIHVAKISQLLPDAFGPANLSQVTNTSRKSNRSSAGE